VQNLRIPCLLGTLKDVNQRDEQAFRIFYLKQDIAMAKKAMILFAIPILGFLVNDYIFFGFSDLFIGLVIVRTVLLIIIALEIISISKVQSHDGYDKIVFWGSLALILGGGIINATRPQFFILHAIVSVVSLLVIYLVIPLRLSLKVFLASIITLGEAFIILVASSNSAVSAIFTVLFCMVIANIIAALASWQIQVYKKKSYADYLRQDELKAALEKHANQLSILVNERTKELVDAQSRLIRSERLAAIGETAGMVGHDLRNPLSSIKNASYLLRKKHLSSDENGRQTLDIVDQSVERANNIVSDLLDYSREMRLDVDEYSPKILVNYALLSITPPSNVKIIDSTHSFPTIWVDQTKIERVFVNLIKNAIDAMVDGGSVEIASKQVNQTLEITFSDTGGGMSEETMQKLFTPLFTTKTHGIGFGLAICKRIIEAHGGEIAVNSALGKGTTFTVILPIKPQMPTLEATIH
jgi:signal transduction histidine kinase